MKKIDQVLLIVVLTIVSISTGLMSQEVIPLPVTVNTDTQWNNPEKEFFSTTWSTQVITNVSKPEMLVYRPANPNGTAVVICPGGALYAHSINSEGIDVAKWLVNKGVTAFVLKYRLVPTGEDGTKDLNAVGEEVIRRAKKILPAAVSDALNAIQYVRDNSEKYKVSKDKIGLIGFSAGGAVTMGATYTYSQKNKPNFIGPVYAWMSVLSSQEVPVDAPPMFVLCAADDPLDLAPASVQLYQDWTQAGKVSELHMYSKGGHGFGMRTQGLPTDNWIERFGDWLGVHGFMNK